MSHFYCREHKTPTPPGFFYVINLYREKRCEVCGKDADVELAEKPLKMPRFTTA